jgi:hypothetical protein
MLKYFVIAAGIIAATAALAQDTAVVFAALDTDKNRSVNEIEAQRNDFVKQNFSRADSDSDGVLSKEEFDAAFG